MHQIQIDAKPLLEKRRESLLTALDEEIMTLQKNCAGYGLEATAYIDGYPIVIEVKTRPQEQASMLDEAEEKLRWQMLIVIGEGMNVCTTGHMVTSADVLKKIMKSAEAVCGAAMAAAFVDQRCREAEE